MWAVWPVGGERQRTKRSEKAEQCRRVEAQALIALCETKKVWNAECVKTEEGQRPNSGGVREVEELNFQVSVLFV